jgi:hypothetical protein
MIVLAGVVALAAGAVSGYLAVSAATGGRSSVPCGDIAGARCVPNVRADAVIGVLEEHGFECEDEFGKECELHIGDTWYRVYAGHHEEGGLLAGYRVQVYHHPALELSPRATGLLTWFAALPFADDPEANDVSREWLAENAGGDGEATIRGLEYQVTTTQEPGIPGLPGVSRQIVELRMQATPDQGNPFTEAPGGGL